MLTLEAITVDLGSFSLSADLTVAAGARVAVIGPSGAGKSTFLGAIAGFQQVAAGRILWDGADISGLDPGQRPLSMVFQDNNLFPHLTARQNVALGLSTAMRLTPDQARQVDQALGRVGLAGLEDRKPAALSGGQQSRVALARVLVRRRPLVLLDEPFSALGPALKSEMLDLVAELTEESGTTLLMVTHDPADARQIADHTIVVADGVAAAPQDTTALLDNPPEALAQYLGSTAQDR